MVQFQEPSLVDLTARVTALEEQNRRLKAIALAALLVGVCLALTAQTHVRERIVEAQEFRLVDQRGVLRGKLATTGDEQGGTAFSLYDRTGKERLAFGASHLLQFIMVKGDSGDVRLAAGPGTTPRMQFVDASGRTRLAFDLADDGPRITLRDMRGTSRLMAGLPNDQPAILFLDAGGRLAHSVSIPK